MSGDVCEGLSSDVMGGGGGGVYQVPTNEHKALKSA